MVCFRFPLYKLASVQHSFQIIIIIVSIYMFVCIYAYSLSSLSFQRTFIRGSVEIRKFSFSPENLYNFVVAICCGCWDRRVLINSTITYEKTLIYNLNKLYFTHLYDGNTLIVLE